jgi:hypothetical protein
MTLFRDLHKLDIPEQLRSTSTYNKNMRVDLEFCNNKERRPVLSKY